MSKKQYLLHLRSWLLHALTFWAIPCFFAWFAFGIAFEKAFVDDREQAFRMLENHVARVAARLPPQNLYGPLFQEHLGTGSATPEWAIGAGPAIASLRNRLPAGSLNITLITAANQVVAWSTDDATASMVLHRHLCRPFADVATISAADMAVMSRSFAMPDLIIALARGRPGELVPLPPSTRRQWLFFTRMPSHHQGDTPGCLAFLDLGHVPPAERVVAARAEIPMNDVVLTPVVDGKPGGTDTAGSAAVNIPRLLARFAVRPGERQETNGQLLVLKRVDAQLTLLAQRPAPAPGKGWPVVALVVAMTSFWYLAVLWRFVTGMQAIRFPLLARLAVFLLLVLGIPMLLTLYFGLMFWHEERSQFAARRGELVQQRLAEIDTGFVRFCQNRAVHYRRALSDIDGRPANASAVVESARGFEREWICDLAFLVSSQAEILLPQGSFNNRVSFRTEWSQPPAVRRDIVRAYIERVVVPDDDEATYKPCNTLLFEEIRDTINAPYPCPMPALEPGGGNNPWINDGSEQTRQLVLFPARRIFDEDRARRQRTGTARNHTDRPGETSARDLLVGSTSDEHELSLNRLPFNLERFFVSAGMAVATKMFFAFVPSSDGEHHYLYYGSHFYYTLERQYLSPLIASAPGFAPGTEIHAVAHTPNSTCFPDPYSYRRFAEIIREVRGSRSQYQAPIETASGPALLVARRCSHLVDYVLVAIVPDHAPDSVAAALTTNRRTVGQLMLLFVLFGVAIGVPLYQRFLARVQRLAEGIEAIRHKRFDFRLQVTGADELAVLAGTFNQALHRMAEMELARIVQQAILPNHQNRHQGWSISGRNEMMEAVGGDYYDYVTLPDGSSGVILADVSGHGLSASMVTAVAKVAVAHTAGRGDQRPESILVETNRLLLEMVRKSKMMTAILALVSADGRRLTLANAGQCSPLVVRRDGTHQLVPLQSLPLGVAKRFVPSTVTLDLTDVIAVVLYSDGLIECVDANHAPIGFDRFAGIAATACRETANQDISVCFERIFSTIDALTRHQPAEDDRTLVVLRREPDPIAVPRKVER